MFNSIILRKFFCINYLQIIYLGQLVIVKLFIYIYFDFIKYFGIRCRFTFHKIKKNEVKDDKYMFE